MGAYRKYLLVIQDFGAGDPLRDLGYVKGLGLAWNTLNLETARVSPQHRILVTVQR